METSPALKVSFPNVFTPRAMKQGQKRYYELTLMVDKADQAQMAWLKTLYAEAIRVMVAAWPDETKRPRIPLMGHDKSPIKDGDTACNGQGVPLSEKNPEYAGHYIIRAASSEDNAPPIVVDRNRQQIMNKGEIYGGCYCKVNINPYARKVSENPGISIGLNGVQKWADGEAFGGGRPSAEDMFGAPSGADDPANYGADPFDGGSQATADPFGGDVPF